MRVGDVMSRDGVKGRVEDGRTRAWAIRSFFKWKSQSVMDRAVFSGQGANPVNMLDFSGACDFKASQGPLLTPSFL